MIISGANKFSFSSPILGNFPEGIDLKRGLRYTASVSITQITIVRTHVTRTGASHACERDRSDFTRTRADNVAIRIYASTVRRTMPSRVQACASTKCDHIHYIRRMACRHCARTRASYCFFTSLLQGHVSSYA